MDLGQDTPEEMDKAIDNAVEEAARNNVSPEGRRELRELLNDYRDVLRVRLGKDPSADVEPMIVELMESARPIVAKPRRYSPQGRMSMERYIDRIIEYGFGKVNTKAK